MLSVESVSSGYGKLRILNEVSLSAGPGELTVVVGPNGSGKSTLLKTIAGLIALQGGSISLDGQVISRLAPHVIARSGVAYLPQTESVFTNLTVSENFRMAGYTIKRADLDARIQESMAFFPRLASFVGEKAVNLSGGERQMVAMTMALIRKPKVVMFDEPTANLSPKIATEVLSTVRSLAKDKGLTVVLVEQNAKKALEMGDKAYLLVGGKNVYQGTAAELLAHKELAQLYLGLRVA
ncbi:MAG: ABC transporter ATP-binding protein [archaeon]|nr:MAG: ABC transporter ATP-binding protein [archaeon]